MGRTARYDYNRVKLRTGEYQKADGHYEYRYTVFGKKYSIYAKDLETLREKEVQILSKETANQTRFNSRTTTLNDVFSLWKELKRGLRPNTFQNYCYMYEQYVQDGLGRKCMKFLFLRVRFYDCNIIINLADLYLTYLSQYFRLCCLLFSIRSPHFKQRTYCSFRHASKQVLRIATRTGM